MYRQEGRVEMERPTKSANHRTGFFGGTFDPVHLGHLILAERAREALGLSRVLFVPANVPPHKVDGRAISSGDHRVEMLRRATDNHEGFEVSTIELERKGVSYTVDSLRDLAASGSAGEIVLLMGSDNARDFRSWRNPAEILEVASIGVWERPGEYFWPEIYPDHIPTKIPAPLIEISSTEIRERTARGDSIRYLTLDSVCEYIHSHRLYSA